MFWKKKNSEQIKSINAAIEFIYLIASAQSVFIALLKITNGYDPKKNILQKILTYLYYDMLAGSLIGVETQLHIDAISLCRDTCLRRLEQSGYEQFRTYHADRKGDFAQLEESSKEFHVFLEQHPIFARAALKVVRELVADIGAISPGDDIGHLHTQLYDLVTSEELKNTLEIEQGISSQKSEASIKREAKQSTVVGPWDKVDDSSVSDQKEKRSFLLEQTIGQQIKNVSAYAKKINQTENLRFQVIAHYYCSYLTAAFLQINDPELIQVKSRAYVSKLTGMSPITFETFETYINANPVFAHTASDFIAKRVNHIFADSFTGNEIPNHFTEIVKELLYLNSDNLSISCQYCGNEWKFEDVNVRSETTLYCMDDYLTNEETGLQVNACLCFRCRRVTEFAADPLNESGLAENAIEYFRTKPLTLQLLFDFHQNAQKHGNEVAKAKMDKLVQNQA